MTPPEGAICLHHTGNHYMLVRTISRSCSQGQLYEMIKMNFERGGVLALPDTATVSAQPSIEVDEASVDQAAFQFHPVQAQDQSVNDEVSDREARAQSPVGGVLYDVAQAPHPAASAPAPDQAPAHHAPIVVGTSGDKLHLFLQLQGHCVKGSVDGFYHWLKSVDIESMSDLKYAVSDDVGFFQKLKDGDGQCGLKVFTSRVFVEAVNACQSQPKPQLQSLPEAKGTDFLVSQVSNSNSANLKAPPEAQLKSQPDALAFLGSKVANASSEVASLPLSYGHGNGRMSASTPKPMSTKIFSSKSLSKIASSPSIRRYPMFSNTVQRNEEEYYEYKHFDLENESFAFDVDQAELVGKLHASQSNNAVTSVTFTEKFIAQGPGRWFQEKLQSKDHCNLRHISFCSLNAKANSVPFQQEGKKGKRASHPFIF
eukprot:scaffold15887_cov113-Skeletonema_marinoi.AAC.1